ncbi:hypothetical protein RKD27_000141 [Streptomyces sp. SAI-126]
MLTHRAALPAAEAAPYLRRRLGVWRHPCPRPYDARPTEAARRRKTNAVATPATRPSGWPCQLTPDCVGAKPTRIDVPRIAAIRRLTSTSSARRSTTR